MTWPWLICFSALVPVWSAAGPGVFRGRVELRDSRDPGVRKRADYAGVVVSLTPLDAHAGARPAPRKYEMLQNEKKFLPHVLAVEQGSEVAFPNRDPIFHNAFSSYSGQIFDVGLYPPGTSRTVRFARPGVVRVFCNIHAAMSAVIVVLDTPYFAVTKSAGTFTINAPPGAYQMRVYHERATDDALAALTRVVQITGQTPAPDTVLVISEAGYLPVPHRNKHGQEYPHATDDRAVYPGVRK